MKPLCYTWTVWYGICNPVVGDTLLWTYSVNLLDTHCISAATSFVEAEAPEVLLMISGPTYPGHLHQGSSQRSFYVDKMRPA